MKETIIQIKTGFKQAIEHTSKIEQSFKFLFSKTNPQLRDSLNSELNDAILEFKNTVPVLSNLLTVITKQMMSVSKEFSVSPEKNQEYTDYKTEWYELILTMNNRITKIGEIIEATKKQKITSSFLGSISSPNSSKNALSKSAVLKFNQQDFTIQQQTIERLDEIEIPFNELRATIKQSMIIFGHVNAVDNKTIYNRLDLVQRFVELNIDLNSLISEKIKIKILEEKNNWIEVYKHAINILTNQFSKEIHEINTNLFAKFHNEIYMESMDENIARLKYFSNRLIPSLIRYTIVLSSNIDVCILCFETVIRIIKKLDELGSFNLVENMMAVISNNGQLPGYELMVKNLSKDGKNFFQEFNEKYTRDINNSVKQNEEVEKKWQQKAKDRLSKELVIPSIVSFERKMVLQKNNIESYKMQLKILVSIIKYFGKLINSDTFLSDWNNRSRHGYKIAMLPTIPQFETLEYMKDVDDTQIIYKAINTKGKQLFKLHSGIIYIYENSQKILSYTVINPQGELIKNKQLPNLKYKNLKDELESLLPVILNFTTASNDTQPLEIKVICDYFRNKKLPSDVGGSDVVISEYELSQIVDILLPKLKEKEIITNDDLFTGLEKVKGILSNKFMQADQKARELSPFFKQECFANVTKRLEYATNSINFYNPNNSSDKCSLYYTSLLSNEEKQIVHEKSIQGKRKDSESQTDINLNLSEEFGVGSSKKFQSKIETNENNLESTIKKGETEISNLNHEQEKFDAKAREAYAEELFDNKIWEFGNKARACSSMIIKDLGGSIFSKKEKALAKTNSQPSISSLFKPIFPAKNNTEKEVLAPKNQR